MLAWTGVDYVFAHGELRFFFLLRAMASLAAWLCVVFAVRLPGGTAEPIYRAWWVFCLLWNFGIAPMVYVMASDPAPYIAGASIVMTAAGVYPIWPLRYVASNVAAQTAILMLALILGNADTAHILLGAFAFVSIGAAAIISAQFRFRGREALYAMHAELASANSQLQDVAAQRQRLFHNVSHELRSPLTMILTPLDGMIGRLQQGIDALSENTGTSSGAATANLGYASAALAHAHPESVPSALTAEDAADISEDLESMRNNARRILRLVDDILELAKIDAGGLTLHVTQVDLVGLARSMTTRVLESGARASGITLKWDGDAETVGMLHGDAHRLEIVIVNLISNAIKYTPSGGSITVGATLAPPLVGNWASDDEAPLTIHVSDTGPGIPVEQQAQIFDRFVQTGNRHAGGVGIGLALAKEIVDMHGGTLSLKSVVGVGSTFSFTIPRRALALTKEAETSDRVNLSYRSTAMGRPSIGIPSLVTDTPALAAAAPRIASVLTQQAAPSSAPQGEAPLSEYPSDAVRRSPRRPTTIPPPPAPKGTVLIVDDDPEIRRVIGKILKKEFRVLTAPDGKSALEIIHSDRPDLVLSDVNMPHGDGESLLKAIRADKSLAGLPVMMLTAQGGDGTESRLLELGAVDFLEKPFAEAVLKARIRRQFGTQRLTQEVVQMASLASLGSMAAAILHEVNNPLGAILGMAQVLSPDKPPELINKAQDIIVDGARRAIEIIDVMRTLVRPAESGALLPLRMNEQIDAAVKMIQAAHREQLFDVDVDCDASIEVYAQPAGLYVVLQNLLDNAIKSGADHIDIKVSKRDGKVATVVTDNGPGIPPEVRKRIFDLYYTTRDVGAGTGIGLYSVKSILESTSGTIELAPSDTGARFVFTMQAPPDA